MGTKKNNLNLKNKLTITLVSIIIVLIGVLLFQQASPSILGKLFGGKVVVVPQGSQLNIVLSTSINSGINRVGDVITGTLSFPLLVGPDEAVPAGSTVLGEVSSVIPAERFKAGKGGSIGIRFTSLQTFNGKRYPISTTAYYVSGETGGSRLAKGVAKTAIGAGAGALLGTAIGAIASGMPGRGAWSGTAIGGGIGATSAIVSKGKEAFISSGRTISVELQQPVQVVAKK